MNRLDHFNYQASKGAEHFLSQLPRYDFAGKYHTENENGSYFNPEDPDYLESLAIYALVFVLIAAVLCGYALCLGTYRGLFTKKTHHSQACLRSFLFLSFVMSLAFLAFGFFESAYLTHHVENTLNDIDTNTQRVHDDLTNITVSMNELNGTTVFGYVVNVPAKFNTTIQEVQNALELWIKTGSPVSHASAKAFNWTIFFILALFLIFSVCGMVTICSKRILLCTGFCIFLWIPLMVAASGFLLYGDIFLVDGCPQVDSYVQNHSSDQQYVAFVWYSQCPPATPDSNPLQDVQDYVAHELETATSALEKAKQFHADKTIIDKLETITQTLTSISVELKDADSCTVTAAMYQQIEDTVCTDVIGGAFILWCLFLVMAVLKCAYGSLLMCCLAEKQHEHLSYHRIINENDDY